MARRRRKRKQTDTSMTLAELAATQALLAETHKAIKALNEERLAEKAAIVAEFGETKKKLALFAETVPLLTSDVAYNPFAATGGATSKLSTVMIAIAVIGLWWFLR